jgi:hypothetical protein
MSAGAVDVSWEVEPQERRAGVSFAILAASVIALTLFLNWFTDGNVAATLAPAIGFTLIYAIWKLPVRITLFALVFLGLTLECPQEVPASNMWLTPWAKLGEMLLSKANDWIDFKPLVFTGVDLIVAYLIFILLWRRAHGSRIDTEGRVQTARVMALASAITFGGILWIWGYGVGTGGDFGSALLQVYKLLYVPLLYFVFQAALRGPADHAAVVKVILAAALYRAALATWVTLTVEPPKGQTSLPYATTHGDSMLFAGAAALVIALINEGVWKKVRGSRVALLACLGGILIGTLNNHRRVAWVEIAVILIALYLTSSWTPLKRAVSRAVMVMAPILLLYVGWGWNSGRGVFAPVHTMRSILDSKSDSSTMWRDLENMDLILDIQQHPILGSGLGYGYTEIIQLPNIRDAFKIYRYVPHNSVLGFLDFAGVLGFTMMWCILAAGVFLAARSYYKSKVPLDRAVALWVIATLIAYVNSTYADMGQTSWTGVFTVCPALGLVSKLAVSSGAWPARVRKHPPHAQPELVSG